MNLLDLYASVSLDTSGYEKGAKEIESSASGLGDKLKTGLSTAVSAVEASMLAIGAAATAAAAAITAVVDSTASYGDNIDKTSQKLGVSAKFYQEWDAVLQHSGTSMEGMTATFKTLQNAAQDGNKAFEALGISLEDAASMSNEELFEKTIYALQSMEEGSERTAIASDLLGRGAMEMGALLNTSAEDTQKMIDTVNELGGVMSDDAVKASAAYEDSLQDMKTGLKSVKTELGMAFTPAFTKAMNTIIAKIPEIKATLKPVIDGASEFAGKIIDWFDNHGPEISEIMTDVCTVIGDSVTTAGKVIGNVFGGVKTAFDTLMEGASKASVDWGGIWDGIQEAVIVASEILGSTLGTLTRLISSVIPTLADVFGATFTVISDLWNNVLSPIFSAIGNAIIDLSDTFGTYWIQIKQAVEPVMIGIADTYEEHLKPCFDALVVFLTETLLPKFKSVFGDVGPYVVAALSMIADFINDYLKPAFDTILDVTASFLDGSWAGAWDLIYMDFYNHFALPVINVINNIIRAINKIPGVDVNGIDVKTFDSLTGEVTGSYDDVHQTGQGGGHGFAKAYNQAYLLDSPTIFGMAGNTPLVAGDGNGYEVVSGEQHLIGLIKDATNNETTNALLYDILVALGKGTTININNREFGRLVRSVEG